jgi:hypothetical protein
VIDVARYRLSVQKERPSVSEGRKMLCTGFRAKISHFSHLLFKVFGR